MSQGVQDRVLIVGGGPAGLATAIALRQVGLEAQVFDRRHPPIDKACGEGLMPDGVEKLAEMGVRIETPQAARFKGIRYLDGQLVAEARFCSGYGLGIRRPRLHQALLRRSEELGVTHHWGVRVVGLTAAGIETESGHVEGRWCIGADGLRSQMRKWARLEVPPPRRRTRQGGHPRSSRFGVRSHFALQPWTDCVEVHWADGCEAYVTPVGPDEVGVAFLWSGEKAGFDTLLQRFPLLERRLRGARSTSEMMGSGPFEQRTRGVWSDRVALVGDAAGYRDAITGEGLALAFQQAHALARALAQGNLEYYQRAFRKLVRLPFGMIRVLLLLERRPTWRRRLIQSLAADAGLFERLLAVHSRQQPIASIGLSRALRLVWKVAGADRSF